MSLIFIRPIKPLLEVWKRFRLMRGEKLIRTTEGKPKQARPCKSHHRHDAFLELP